MTLADLRPVMTTGTVLVVLLSSCSRAGWRVDDNERDGDSSTVSDVTVGDAIDDKSFEDAMREEPRGGLDAVGGDLVVVDAAIDDAEVKSCSQEHIQYQGFCWYYGSVGQSCTQVCASHGGVDLAGTVDFAGSNGSRDNCVAIFAEVFNITQLTAYTAGTALGCFFDVGDQPKWDGSTPTTVESAALNMRRICACNM